MKIFSTLLLFFAFSISHAQCFQVEQILIDSCDDSDEGQNEMVRFRVGSLNLNTNNLSVDWPAQTWQGLVQNTQTAAIVAQINTAIQSEGGCGQVLQPSAASLGFMLPANSVVILVTGLNFDTAANTFGSLSETVYMIFQNNPSVVQGHFGNYSSSPGLRT
jgi:hypothetical protein